MAVNWSVVKAFRESHTIEQLIAKRNLAVEEVMSGVTVTQVTFEGGGASGQPMQAPPAYVLEHLQAAVDGDSPSAARSSFMDLSGRPFST